MKLRDLYPPSVVVCIMMVVIGLAACCLVSCSAGQVRETIEAHKPKVKAYLDYHDAVAAVIDRVAAGGIVDEQALAAIREVLSPEDQLKLDAALQKGEDAALAVKRVADGIRDTAQTMMDEFEKLTLKYADAKASDDATVDVINSVTRVIAGLFIPGGVLASFLGFRAGQVSGAQEVGKSVTIVEEDFLDLKLRSPRLATAVFRELELDAKVVRPTDKAAA